LQLLATGVVSHREELIKICKGTALRNKQTKQTGYGMNHLDKIMIIQRSYTELAFLKATKCFEREINFIAYVSFTS
jgi:hypothetical protein